MKKIINIIFFILGIAFITTIGYLISSNPFQWLDETCRSILQIFILIASIIVYTFGQYEKASNSIWGK